MTTPTFPPDGSRLVEPWVLFAIAVAMVALRSFARIHAVGVRNLELDDWAMNIAVVSNKTVNLPRLDWVNL